MNNGYIKLWRCIKDNPLWFEEPFTRGQAWVDLLMVANHQAGSMRRRGIRVSVRRGEVGMSLRELSGRWRWSLGKVQRFFDELKSDSQVHYRTDTENVSVTTLICISNYERYQCSDTEIDTEIDTETGTEQECKEEEELKERKTKRKKSEVVLKKDVGILHVSVPFWIPSQAWGEYLKMRRAIKKELQPESYHLAFSKLEKLKLAGNDVTEVLEQSTFHNWQGLFEVRVDDKNKSGSKQTFTEIKMDNTKRVMGEFMSKGDENARIEQDGIHLIDG